jgi:hypothetical protein
VADKPTYMAPEEVKKRVAAGLENWRRQGRVTDMTDKMAAGNGLAKAARVALLQHTQAAIMFLAERQFSEWAHEVHNIHGIMSRNDLGYQAFTDVLTGIEVAAINISNDSQLGNMARHFLQAERKRDTIFSIPGTKPGDTQH